MQVRFELDLALTLDCSKYNPNEDEFEPSIQEFNVKQGEMYVVTKVEWTDEKHTHANLWFEKPEGVVYEVPAHQFILHDTVGANISLQALCCGDKR